jgi:hypothetical protein
MLKNSNATIKKNHSERKIAPNTIIKLMLVLIVTDTKLSYKLKFPYRHSFVEKGFTPHLLIAQDSSLLPLFGRNRTASRQIKQLHINAANIANTFINIFIYKII